MSDASAKGPPEGYRYKQVPWKKATGLEVGAFVGADIVGAIASTAVMSINDQGKIIKPMLDSASKEVSQMLVLPHLDRIENFLSKVCKLEECQPDMTKSREERAELLARTGIRFATAFAVSMGVKLISREIFNRGLGVVDSETRLSPNASMWEKTVDHFRVTPRAGFLFAGDELVHLGTMALMNTKGAKCTDTLIKHTAAILEKCTPLNAKQARDAATTIYVWEASNFAGIIAASAGIAATNRFGLFTDTPGKRDFVNMLEKIPTSGHSI